MVFCSFKGQADNSTSSNATEPIGPPPRRVYCLTLSAMVHEEEGERREEEATKDDAKTEEEAKEAAKVSDGTDSEG